MNNEISNMNLQPDTYEVPKILTRKTKRLIFYTLMVALPFAQFLLFYVYVHFNSILMAFKINTIEGNKMVTTWTFGGNFEAVFNNLKNDEYIGVVNSLKNYFITFFTSGIFSVFFSYYVYKKFALSGMFKIFLYLPSIISGIILVTIYKQLVQRVIPETINKWFYDSQDITPDLLDPKVGDPYTWVLVYYIFMHLGGHILMYTGAMSGINESVVESAQLDGVNAIQEFFYITLPLIYPTFVTFTVTGVATIFTAHPNLHTFFGLTTPFSYRIHTVGFLIFASVRENVSIEAKGDTGLLSLNQVSALGLMITAVMLPITLLLKKYMTKWGPSSD